MSSRIALVVEDDPSTRVLLLLLLSRLPDVSVIAASSVAEGKALAGAVRFDVAVLDLVLGDGTGFEVLEKLRGDNRPDCVVLASAYIERFRGTVQIEPNVVLMEKPIEAKRLYDAIDQVAKGVEPLFHFTVPEYLQVACMGLHSVRLEISRAERVLGGITIREGTLWSASDSEGTGEDAFRRLLGQSDVRVICRAPTRETERDINRNWQNVLLDAARISDERGAAPELELSMDDFDFEESSPGVEVDVPAMIELAARAVRSSRFRDAYVAYARVLEVEPQNSLARLNASRLRKLGFGDEAREAS